MLGEIVSALECPVCTAAMSQANGALTCAQGHSFDIAREGYVNLLLFGTHAGSADSLQMVRARERFLGAGHFDWIADALAETLLGHLAPDTPGIVVDSGAGTGRYLATELDAMPERFGLALDISKHAARVSARAHPRAGAVVCDAWGRLPLRAESACALTCAFAPRNAPEFARVLVPGGVCVIATPRHDHLAELVGTLGLIGMDAEKDARLEALMAADFDELRRVDLEATMRLSRADALDAAAMGPSAIHASADHLARRADALADRTDVTGAVTIRAYRRRISSAPRAGVVTEAQP